jgi:GDPmannose 4,6-dehydratase
VEVLIADAGKSEKVLGWKPAVKFADLVKIMVDADMKAAGLDPIGKGEDIIRAKFPRRWWKSD